MSRADSNLGLSMSHRLNYEAAPLTTRTPQPDHVQMYSTLGLTILPAKTSKLCIQTTFMNYIMDKSKKWTG